MGKKRKNKKRKQASRWTPPKGAGAYFDPASDDAFREKHPVGYGFLVMLGIAALLLPVVLYMAFLLPMDINSPWLILGWVGGFVMGIGLFNYVAILIEQFLGHLLSILSFLVGGILILVSLAQMGIL